MEREIREAMEDSGAEPKYSAKALELSEKVDALAAGTPDNSSVVTERVELSKTQDPVTEGEHIYISKPCIRAAMPPEAVSSGQDAFVKQNMHSEILKVVRTSTTGEFPVSQGPGWCPLPGGSCGVSRAQGSQPVGYVPPADGKYKKIVVGSQTFLEGGTFFLSETGAYLLGLRG